MSGLELPAIPAPDLDAAGRAQARQRRLTKPPGSLGRLEQLSVQLAGATGNPEPRFERRAVVIMAADHGVAVEGVSAYPAEVTAQMVANFCAGGAAINVLARLAGAAVVVVDVGINHPVDTVCGAADVVLRSARVRAGTANLARAPAMSHDDAVRALTVGLATARELIADGVQLLAVGDMGIGNTTSAAAIVAALTGRPVAAVTGRGTGIDNAALIRKRAVVERALALHRLAAAAPLDVLSHVGGLEIAALVGVMLAAAAARVPVVIDGYITGAAALVAVALRPALISYLVAAHRSVEPGHQLVLNHLGLRPLLDLELRLGEGSGAALALPLVVAAARSLTDMATFDQAGVSDAERSS